MRLPGLTIYGRMPKAEQDVKFSDEEGMLIVGTPPAQTKQPLTTSSVDDVRAENMTEEFFRQNLPFAKVQVPDEHYGNDPFKQELVTSTLSIVAGLVPHSAVVVPFSKKDPTFDDWFWAGFDVSLGVAMAKGSQLETKYNGKKYMTPKYRANRKAVLKGDQVCEYCGKQPGTTTDHIISRYDYDSVVDLLISGEKARDMCNELDNLARACVSCNSAKQQRWPGNIPGRGYWRPPNPNERILGIMKSLGTWRDEFE